MSPVLPHSKWPLVDALSYTVWGGPKEMVSSDRPLGIDEEQKDKRIYIQL